MPILNPKICVNFYFYVFLSAPLETNLVVPKQNQMQLLALVCFRTRTFLLTVFVLPESAVLIDILFVSINFVIFHFLKINIIVFLS